MGVGPSGAGPPPPQALASATAKTGSNAPSKQPPPLAPTKRKGHRVDKNCSTATLVHNDRGRCVRDLQWLLTAQDPAWRPTRAYKGHQHGANVDRRYWRIRTDNPTGVYGKATTWQVQTVKRKLGFPVQSANGAAGPKLRAYLLGRPLPQNYLDRKEKRYQVWKERSAGPAPRVRKLIDLAYRAIALHNWFYYTQTSSRSDLVRYGHLPPPRMGGDCSGSISALYKIAGLPATGSVFPYDWTGSMQARGHVVWRAGQSLTRLKPGDLVFYGPYPEFHHVTMVLTKDGGRVYSFGQNGCPCNNSTLYRGDAQLARRYAG
jgi:hypothetical protein